MNALGRHATGRLRFLAAAASFLGALGLLLAGGLIPSSASAAGTVAWSLQNVSQPTPFSTEDEARCQGPFVFGRHCDAYELLATNVGDEVSTGAITLVDELPRGLRPLEVLTGFGFEGGLEWACTEAESSAEQWTVTCVLEEEIPAGGYTPWLTIQVSAPTVGMSGTLVSEASVDGGGAVGVTAARNETPIGSGAPSFALSNFSILPTQLGNSPAIDAGGHPWEFTTTFKVPSILAGEVGPNAFQPLSNLKSVAALLPPGFIGNPRAVGTCTPLQLKNGACPTNSRVGKMALLAGGISGGNFDYSGGESTSAIYNMVPERGFPAEFGFTYAHISVFLYASVIRGGPSGYQVRVLSPGIPSALETSYVALRFFGDPGKLDETGEDPAFLTNPVDCQEGPLESGLEVERWEQPGDSVVATTTSYSQLTGCGALPFHPILSLQPVAGETRTPLTSADSPAGLSVDLQVPQTSGFEELATPPLKTARVVLPEGLVVNPAAADGLAGCGPKGPQGINIGSSNIGARGRDLGEPEATELGEGHAGGNSSPYDDGYYHTAPGHCPADSTLGTVEATTPLLPEPIHGQIFLGTPECAPCSSVDAESGKLLKLYLEINDPKTGTILKLPGSVSANASTGRLTATFAENPQLPFSDLKLHFKTGPRAALTSPQTCGTYSTSSSLEPWSAPETPTAVSNSSFDINSGPQGCGAPPNKPHFEAGTTSTQAGAFAPFVLKLSREDGTQRLKALNVTLPPGLTGKLAGVQECSAAAISVAEGKGGKAEQASPSCPLASQLGTVNVGAGSGPDPYYVQGHAYLAGPYKGAPLSMAIITPAVAGPFDLGTVVVRAALFVNPETAQITVKSDQLPQIVSGVPLDVRSIAVNISRNQFTLNPTSCDPKALAASIVADASTAAVSNPFQVGGCSSLGFKPTLKLSLKGATKRSGVPALKAVLTYPQGGNYANVRSASVVLPRSEFIDNAHIGNTCTRVQFNAGAGNGAQCPKRSILGHSIAYTPLLEKPLEGTVYLRSNGGERELPDIVAALHGQIDINLVGFIDSVKKNKNSEVSRLRTRFANAPDAPVSRFVLQLAGAKHGLLENSENLCGKAQRASVKLTAQNGKTYDTEPLVANDCGKKHKKKSKGRGKGSQPVGSSHR